MYRFKNIKTVWFALLAIFLIAASCKESTQQHQHATASQGEVYICPMHPQIIRDKPGNCPICGMKLVKKESSNAKLNDIQLQSLLKPTNEFVVSTVPVTTMHKNDVSTELQALGMSSYQLDELMRTQKIAYTITVYSPYTGHVHEAGNMNNLDNTSGLRTDASQSSEQLSLKEGMYLQKGQPIISVFSTEHAWALLNIYTNDQNLVKAGDAVTIIPETAPGNAFKSTISFIEPFYRSGSKTLTARVYFNNTDLKYQ